MKSQDKCQALIDNDDTSAAHGAVEPNRTEAERFLTLLDETADGFTFQTFDDSKDRHNSELARVLHGTLDEHYNTLASLNKLGAGVFVTVNRTDLKGRKKENIIGIRAVFQEADRSDVPLLPFAPHLSVESSPGKYHRYSNSRRLIFQRDACLILATVEENVILKHSFKNFSPGIAVTATSW
jgi:hypothetical protein